MFPVIEMIFVYFLFSVVSTVPAPKTFLVKTKDHKTAKGFDYKNDDGWKNTEQEHPDGVWKDVEEPGQDYTDSDGGEKETKSKRDKKDRNSKRNKKDLTKKTKGLDYANESSKNKTKQVVRKTKHADYSADYELPPQWIN